MKKLILILALLLPTYAFAFLPDCSDDISKGQGCCNPVTGHLFVGTGTSALDIGIPASGPCNVYTPPTTGSVGVPYEPALGNPSVTGYCLISTTTGTRSWGICGSGGGSMVYPSGSGFSMVTGGNAWTTTLADPLIGTHGGTGSQYFTVAGPTVARTFTFPDASTTICGTNAVCSGYQASGSYVPQSTTVNGHALSGNVVVTPTDLSLVIGTNVQAYNANLTTYAGIAPSANSQTLLGHTFSQMLTDMGAQAALTNPVTGTGTQYYLPYWTGSGTVGALAGLGSSGQVLTSNGAGSAPTFQAATGGGNFSATITSPATGDLIYYNGSAWVNVHKGANYSLLGIDGSGVFGYQTSLSLTSLDLSTATLIVPSSTTLPGTCSVGMIYMDTDATSGQRLYACESTNTWVLQGDGGGGGGANANGYYLVNRATNAPTNAINLGALTTGLQLNTVSSSIATPSTYGGTSCTNQVPTALSASGAATCTTLTSSYVNNTIALTGTDINTSNQVTVTHLASALPVAQGGTAITDFSLSGSGHKVASAGFTNPAGNKCVEVDSSGNLQIAGTNAVCGSGGSGLSTSLTAAHIYVGNGSGVATDVAASGDVTLANTGAFSVVKIAGYDVDTAAPSDGDVHQYSTGSSKWLHVSPATLKTSLSLVKGDVGLGNVENTALSTGNAGSATKSTNLIGGNGTTLLGAVPYQSNTDTTSFVVNTTSTKKFLRETGTGTNGAAPAWDTLVASDIPTANTVTLTGAYTLGFTLSGTTALTLPTSGTVATTAAFPSGTIVGTTDTQVLTGKTLTSNVYDTVTNTALASTTINLDGVSYADYNYSNGTTAASYTTGWTSRPASGKVRYITLTLNPSKASGVITMTWTGVTWIGTAGAGATTASKASTYACMVGNSTSYCAIIGEAY